MAETYLYATKANTQQLKDDVKAAGGAVKWDKERGAFALRTENLSKDQIAEIKGKLPQYIGDAARKVWKADREANLAASPVEKLRGEARKREATTTEPKPKTVVSDQGITVYPAISQKEDFRKLLIATESQSKYHQPKGEIGAHYKVVTTAPDKFAQYQGPEAEARFKQEFAELQAEGGKPKAVNNDVERARTEAAKRQGGAFMAQYLERGFRLSDKEAQPGNHQKQLNEMTDATKAQLYTVLQVSQAQFKALQTKEIAARAEASGLTVEQVSAMPLAEQKALTGADGKAVSLTGDDFKVFHQLRRGIEAIQAHMDHLGMGRRKEQEQGQGKSQDKAPAKDQAAEKPKAKAISAETSADRDLDFAAQMAAHARGRGGAGR